MPTPPTSPRLLRLHGLRPLDEAAVRVFLMRAGEYTHQPWALSSAAHTDVLLRALPAPSSGATPSNELGAEPSATVVVWVARPDANVPPACQPLLHQPLQMEAFFEMLKRVEAPLAASTNPATIATPSPTAVVPSVVPAANRTQAALLQPGLGFKLRRWPTARSIAAQRHLPRLASLLVPRHLSLGQLVQLSRVSRADCLAFLEEMHSQSLLEVRTLVAAPPPAPSTAQLAGVPAGAPSLGLLDRLRQRLGLL